MVTNKRFYFKRAIFPLIMTVLAFLCFVPIFWSYTINYINPQYFFSLLFAIPALIFGIIAFFTWIGRFELLASIITTAVLVPALAMSGFFGVMWMSFGFGVLQSTTDVARYERVLRVQTNNSNRALFEKFPRSIPATASEVSFHYYLSLWRRSSETMTLRFTESPERITEYITEFSAIAESSGVKDGFTVFLLYSSEQGRSGRTSTVSISTEKNQIIFSAQRW